MAICMTRKALRMMLRALGLRIGWAVRGGATSDGLHWNHWCQSNGSADTSSLWIWPIDLQIDLQMYAIKCRAWRRGTNATSKPGEKKAATTRSLYWRNNFDQLSASIETHWTEPEAIYSSLSLKVRGTSCCRGERKERLRVNTLLYGHVTGMGTKLTWNARFCEF